MTNTAKPSMGKVLLKGTIIALAIHLGAQMLLAAMTVNEILPEHLVFPVQAVICAIASIVGGLYTARRSSWGTLSGALATGALFAIVLLLLGLSIFNTIDWSGHGGILLLAILCGAVAAGLLGSRRTAQRKRKRARP